MKILIAALALSCQAAAASAAVPQFGSKEGDLTCLGLVGLGFRGSIAAKPQDPKMVTTAAVAYSYYLGRLSVAAPNASTVALRTSYRVCTWKPRKRATRT